MEFVITLIIVGFSAFILYKNLNKSSKGDCSCGTCSNHCPSYKDKNKKL